jgi:hypothetical protein
MFTLNYVVSNLAWSLLMILLTKLYEWVRGKPFDVQRKKAFWIVSFLAIFTFISMLTYAVRGPQSPELQGGFDSITFTPLPDAKNDAGILVVFHVSNVGTPSIVENYSLTITPPGGNPVEALPLLIPKTLSLPTAAGVDPIFPLSMVCGKDALYRKTADQPLTNGAMARGLLWYQVPGYTMQTFSNPTGTKFRLSFVDVRNHEYVREFTWGGISKPSGYMPGLALPKSKKPEQACD